MFQCSRAHSAFVLLTEYCWCVFWYMKQQGIPCDFYFFLNISLNGWNLRTFFTWNIHLPVRYPSLNIIELIRWSEALQRCDCKCEAEPDYFVWRIKRRMIKQSQPSGTSGLASKSGLAVGMAFTASIMQEAPSCSHVCSSEFFNHLVCKHLFDILEIPRQDCRNSYHVLYRKPEVLLP